MPFKVAIVAEGPTDVAVIRNLVAGITEVRNNGFRLLKPPSVTEPYSPSEISNWSQVLAFCSSEEFREVFSFVDFVVIQIDTDQYDPVNFNIPTHENGKETLPMRKYNLAREIIISRIGQPFYETVRQQVVFAICVESIECWLLPLYFPSDRAKRKKTKNCYDTLVKHEQARSLEKSYAWYQALSRPYAKRKAIDKGALHSESLRQFVAETDVYLAQQPTPSPEQP